MQTKQLGRIKTLKEKLHASEGRIQDLEHKLAKQDHILTNLVGDNLKHLPLGTRTHIPSRHIVNALWGQTTLDHNGPSD